MTVIRMTYDEARREIRDADLLLFRRRSLAAKLIAVAGRSQYVHAAMAGWWKRPADVRRDDR